MDVTIFVTGFLAFVLYLNTLDADFAYDDSRAIVKNQDLQPQTPLTNIFYDDFWGTPLIHSGSHKSYRPLCVLSFRINYAFGELNPWGYHLGNVILHCIVTMLFTKLSRVLLKDSFPALISGLIFASHPIHTEAVAGVVGRADIGACLFFILAILCYMKYVYHRDSAHDPGGDDGAGVTRFVYFGGTAVMTTASMLTKEQGVTVLGVCAAYDLFVHNKMKIPQILRFFSKAKDRRAMEGVFLLGLLGVALVAFRIYFMENKPPEFAPSDNPASDSDSALTRALTYLLLPSLNIWMLLCPRVLSFDWSMSAIPLVESVWDYRNLFTVVFYSILVYLAYYILVFIHEHSSEAVPYMNGNGHSSALHSNSKHSQNKSSRISPQRQSSVTRDYSSSSSSSSSTPSLKCLSSHSINVLVFSIALLVFPFIPATNLFFYVGFVIAERVLYIPSMGFCLIVGHGAYVLYKKWESEGSKQKLLVAVVTVLILLNGGQTMRRNLDWKTEERLYSSGIATNPPKAWGNLANIFNHQGRVTDAETAYRNALKYRPNMSDVHYNLGILLQHQGRYKEAVESYHTAISYRPNLSMAHLNLGILLAQLGETDKAEKVYRHCADLDTEKLKDPRLHASTKISCLYNLGRLYSDLSRYEEASAVFEEALRKRPDHYAPHSLFNLYGEVFANTGRYAEAQHWFQESLNAKPDHIPAHITMAKLNQKMGNHKEAETWFLRAKEVDPTDMTIFQHYAQFLSEVGRLDESATMYRKVRSVESETFENTFNLANVLRQIRQNDEAEQLFLRATQIKPDEATAHMNLGAMFHINGKLKEAEQSYLKALKLRPNDKITMENLKKLQQMMK